MQISLIFGSAHATKTSGNQAMSLTIEVNKNVIHLSMDNRKYFL